MREGLFRRHTGETEIELRIDLDALPGSCSVMTNERFFDHMLRAFACHGNILIEGYARSLDGISHHLIEDMALVLGRAIGDALKDRSGIERFGSALVPMDESLVRAVVDFSGRPSARIALPLNRDRVEDLDTQLVSHFFRSLAQTMGATLHIDLLAGQDAHHATEAAFKACARACRDGWSLSRGGSMMSTKGQLG